MNNNSNNNNNNNNNKKQVPTFLPKGNILLQHLRQKSSWQETVNCYCKDPHPSVCRDHRFTSFLCKCNLTKKNILLVSVKHFSISY